MKEIIYQELSKRGASTEINLRRRLKKTHPGLPSTLQPYLNELEKEERIIRVGPEYFPLDSRFAYGKAKYDRNMNYSIAIEDGTRRFVDFADGCGAMAQDRVLVYTPLVQKGVKPRSKIVRILERGTVRLVGVLKQTSRRQKVFWPDVEQPFTFSVSGGRYQLSDISSGTKVCVEVTGYPAAPANAGKNGVVRNHSGSRPVIQVRIAEVLGSADDPGVDVLGRLYANGVEPVFSQQTLEEVQEVPSSVSEEEVKGRQDLRSLLTVTIDGDDSKDFDDAISLQKLRDGYRLYVHIADVSHYVKEESAIDKDAYKRGTSVYAGDRVVPMLPFELSNGICSLNPDEDRLAVTVEMVYSETGEQLSARAYESVIRSDRRCTYHKVNDLLSGLPEASEEYADLSEMLHNFSKLAYRLKEDARRRGCIDFETAEPKFVFDENSEPVDMLVKERGWAEEMIEQAMVAANVAVAHMLHEKDFPNIYRVHQKPDETKLETLHSAMQSLNVENRIGEDLTSLDIQQMLNGIEDPQVRTVMSMLSLRAMMKAGYSPECIGHFGLALEEYSHFTSPIRRYPDLLTHRMLKKYLICRDPKTPMHPDTDRQKLETQAAWLSEREAIAVVAERDVNSMLAAWYASRHIGETAVGMVTGTASFGFFVELPNGMEGLVPMRTLEGQWMYDERAHTLFAPYDDEDRQISLGQKVEVCITDASKEQGKVTFAYLERPVSFVPDETVRQEARF